jgi:hypothetical protein
MNAKWRKGYARKDPSTCNRAELGRSRAAPLQDTGAEEESCRLDAIEA